MWQFLRRHDQQPLPTPLRDGRAIHQAGCRSVSLNTTPSTRMLTLRRTRLPESAARGVSLPASRRRGQGIRRNTQSLPSIDPVCRPRGVIGDGRATAPDSTRGEGSADRRGPVPVGVNGGGKEAGTQPGRQADERAPRMG
jgi:hypothetical protein